MEAIGQAAMRGEHITPRGESNPYLANVCDDPLLSGCLVYALPPGEDVTVGSGSGLRRGRTWR